LKPGTSLKRRRRRSGVIHLQRHHDPRSRRSGPKREGFVEGLLESLREPLQLLLIGVGALSITWDEVRDGVAIFVIILAVASIRRARAQTIALAPLSDSETAEFRRLLPSDLADWRTSTPT